MIELFDCGAQAETVLGGLGVRTFQLPTAGDQIGGHQHHFDHVMFIASGRVRVHLTCDEGCDKTADVEAGTFLLVEKRFKHSVLALTDGVKGWCVFPEYDATGARGQQFMADLP